MRKVCMCFVLCFLLGQDYLFKGGSGYCETIEGKIAIEGENYTRSDDEEVLFPPKVCYSSSASGNKFVVVRRIDTGGARWVEYDFNIKEDGIYSVFIVAGGNDSRQSAYVSIDREEEIFIEDNVTKEDVFTSYLIGRFDLKKGTHTIKVRHSEKGNYSNSFGIDRIEIKKDGGEK